MTRRIAAIAASAVGGRDRRRDRRAHPRCGSLADGDGEQGAQRCGDRVGRSQRHLLQRFLGADRRTAQRVAQILQPLGDALDATAFLVGAGRRAAIVPRTPPTSPTSNASSTQRVASSTRNGGGQRPTASLVPLEPEGIDGRRCAGGLSRSGAMACNATSNASSEQQAPPRARRRSVGRWWPIIAHTARASRPSRHARGGAFRRRCATTGWRTRGVAAQSRSSMGRCGSEAGVHGGRSPRAAD